MTTAPNVPAETNAIAERALQIIESMPTFAWLADPSGKFTYVSPNALAYLGASPEDLNPLPDGDEFGWRQVVHPDDYGWVAARWRHCLQTGDDYDGEQRLRRADGVYRWFRNFGRPSRDSHGRIAEWYGTTIDIDEQKQAEAALSARQREFSQLVDMVPSHIWRLTPDGEPIFFNKRMVDFLGLDVADTDKPGMSRLEAIIETIHPDDAATFRDGINGCLVTGETFAMRYRLRRADGVYRWMSSRAEPMRDQDGRIVQWYGLCHDIDDQVHAEEALRRSERQLQEMIDTLPVRIWSAASLGGPIYFNKRYQDYLRSVIPNFEILGEPGVEKFMQELIHPEDAPDVRRSLQGCFETGNGAVMRFRWLEKGGAYRWSECKVEPRRDNDGAVVQWYGASVDIDDEVRAHEALRARERALRQSERQLQQMIDAVPAMMWSTSRDGTPAYVNKRFTDVIGATLKDITASDGSPALARIIHPDDLGETVAKVGESFRTGVPYVMRYRQLRRDGSYRWTETRAEALRDESGQILQWYGVGVDIHDMVTAQEALRDRERELSQLVDMVPVYIRRMTPQGEPIFFNKRVMDFHGLGDIADLDKPGMSRLAAAIQALIHPEDAANLLATAHRSFASGEPFSMKYRTRRADGAYCWIDTRAEPLRNQSGAIVQWYVVSLDIDDEMRVQQALRDRERELSQLVDMVPSLLWRLNPDGEPNFFNKRTIDFLGLDAADYDKPGMSRLAATLIAIIHPDDTAGVTEGLKHSLVTGEPFSMTYRLRRADGVYRWVSGRAEPMRDKSGRIVQWYGLAHDIDDQMRAEEALRERERELSLLVDMIPSHLWRVAPDGETTLVNRHMVEFFGEDWKMKWDTAIDTIVHPDDLKGVLDEFGRCLRTGDCFSMQYRLRRLDGVYRWMSGRAEPMLDENGRILHWFGLCHDIDDQVHAEEALRRASDKLARATQAASLAELSASIAHEVNQPLAAIVTNSEACDRWLSAEPPNLERAKITAARITRDANSAADVVSRIRALFRRAPQSRSRDDINLMIREVCRLMADEIAAKGINIETNLEQELPSVAIDRVQIQQVFVNLIRNGIEAMDGVVDGARPLHIRTCRDGVDALRVEVRDAGTGFKDSDRVFEPFFTTKQHGMGMGLAICRSIVEAHGGRLWTANNETRGATVAFTLALAARDAP